MTDLESANREKEMLPKHLPFYLSLAKGVRQPSTPAQEHFVQVVKGNASPETEHEMLYLAYAQKKKVADAVEEDERRRQQMIDEIEPGIGQRSYPARVRIYQGHAMNHSFRRDDEPLF